MTIMQIHGTEQIIAGTLPAGSGLADPSGLIGMSAVNGVAVTGLRSDGRHALDPAIAPTWTGVHVWSPTDTTITSGTYKALDIQADNYDPSSSSSALYLGLNILSSTKAGNAQNFTGTIYGVSLTAQHAGEGTVTTINGVTSQIYNSGTAGIITNAFAWYISTPYSPTGTIVNSDGLYIETQNVGTTTNYAIRTAGAGLVKIGDTTDSISKDTGAFVVEGGAGFEKAMTIGTVAAIGTTPTSTIGLKVSNGTNGATITVSDAGTTTSAVIVTSQHLSSGTPAANFGVSHLYQLHSSTNTTRTVRTDEVRWVVATDGSRTARGIFYIYDTAAREAFRVEASGAAAMIGFLGAAASIRQTGGAATAGVVYTATEQAMLQAAYDCLRTFGLLT